MWVSTPEQRRKKRFNMMIDLSPKRVRMIVMIDDYTNITPKAWVYCKALIFNKKPAQSILKERIFIIFS
jgi:hypothetical protein